MAEMESSLKSLEDDLRELRKALLVNDAAHVDHVCRTGRIPHEVMDKGDPIVFDDWTPLTHAIFKGCSLPILDRLIQNGARVDTPDPYWKITPLATAVEMNRSDVAKHLLHWHGADPNVTMTSTWTKL